MQILKITLGFLALVLAWSLLFRTGIIFRLNAWLKENIFNDQVVLYSRRRLALLLFFLGLVSLFSGVENVMRSPVISAEASAMFLQEAQESFNKRQYQRTIAVCRTVIKSSPQNKQARELLANALWSKGQKEEARKTAKILLQQDPDNPKFKNLVNKFTTKKGEEK